MASTEERIAVIGLGYVGLPVAVALGRCYTGAVGFDISERRIAALRAQHDATGEIDAQELAASTLHFTDDPADLKDCTFFIVTVPTPIDEFRKPDLRPIESACEIIGKVLRPGAAVIFESTVYPGVTEDICGPLLEKVSGLRRGRDFRLGYSPERINPGDRVHRLETIIKIVAAEDDETLERVKKVYGSIVTAGLHIAPTIKVAEAAKVLENTQRDLNIALMNELSSILDLMDIRTKDVLEAAGTKWNFLGFSPGLVGGHCIGVDPYYLTHACERLGYRPEVILSGRRINDSMGQRIATKTIKLLSKSGGVIRDAKVGVLGLTFKENVPDLRNSKVPDILRELESYGITALVHDPLADPAEAAHEYGVALCALEDLRDLDALIFAVDHAQYRDRHAALIAGVKAGGAIIDVKSALDPATVPADKVYWSL